MQFAARVMPFDRTPHAGRQLDGRIDDGLTQHLLQRIGDRLRVPSITAASIAANRRSRPVNGSGEDISPMARL